MRYRRRKMSPAPTLMLTSLLDMFTIILIFLIVSFDAESQNLHLNADVQLPESSARADLKPGVALEVTLDGVQMDSRRIVALSQGHATEAQYAAGELPELVTALQKVYDERYAQDATDGEDASGDEAAIVLVQADRRLDYKTIYLVLRSAARGGFFRYRLVIMKA